MLLLFGVVLTGLIGLFVYLRDPGRAVNRTWGGMCASVSWWYFGRYMRLTSLNEVDALFWCRFMYMGAVFAPSLFVHFVYSLLGIQKKKLVILLYSMSFIFFVSNFTHLFIKSISLKISIYYPVPGVLYPLYLIFFLVCLNIGFFELIKAYRRAVGYRRNQLKYLFFASIIGFLSALSTFPLVYNIQVPPVGAPFVSAYTLIVAYAIVKYRLMDINLVIKKGVLYSFFLLLLLTPCVVLIMFAQKYFFGSIDYSFSCIVLILLAITI